MIAPDTSPGSPGRAPDNLPSEDALRVMEMKFRAFVEASPDIIWEVDMSGNFTYISPRSERQLGYPPGELVGRPVFSLLEPASLSRVKNVFLASAQDKRSFVILEVPVRHRDGRSLVFEIRSVRITDRSGNITGFRGIARDITDRKNAEQALRESEERYSALFSRNYSISLLIDPDTAAIVDANDAAVRYYGYDRARLLSMKISDLNRLPEEKVTRDLNRAKTEREKHFYSTHYRAGGDKRSVEIYSGPITVQGRPVFYSIIHDITDRERAEQALQESEERYRTLIDQIPDYVIVHRNGTLLYVNPAAAAQLGYALEDLIGKSLTLFVAPEDQEMIKTMMIRRLAGETVSPYEMRIVARDGAPHTLLVNGALIQYMGQPASLNVLTDITPVKAAEETIRRANEVLELRVAERTDALTKANVQMGEEIAARKKAELEIGRSLAEKELLLREIHHRVKNNLQIIISLLNLQSRHIQDRNVLDAIQDSQNRVRAMALVHERIYRSESIATINLRDYISYLVNQLFGFYTIPHSRIGISIAMEDYPADIDLAIPIGLILNELVTNSIKHAFPDGKSGEISIGCTLPAPDTLRFVYRDDGIGFPGGFDWKNPESLGLRLVNSLVDQLDGTIEKGTAGGTMFIITLHRKTI